MSDSMQGDEVVVELSRLAQVIDDVGGDLYDAINRLTKAVEALGSARSEKAAPAVTARRLAEDMAAFMKEMNWPESAKEPYEPPKVTRMVHADLTPEERLAVERCATCGLAECQCLEKLLLRSLQENAIKGFHEHLDACQQCRDNPFALCKDGEGLLLKAGKSVAAIKFNENLP